MKLIPSWWTFGLTAGTSIEAYGQGRPLVLVLAMVATLATLKLTPVEQTVSDR